MAKANSENASSLPREISIGDGILQLNPKSKPCDSMIQTFFLNSMFWHYVGDLDSQEQIKLLERDIDFARFKLGFRFIHQETKSEASNGEAIDALLNWKTLKVQEHVPETTFRHLQEATNNMMINQKQNSPGMQGRPHRLQRVVDEMTAVSADEDDAYGLSSTEPQPIDVGSNHSIIPDIPFEQLRGLFDSVDSQPEEEKLDDNAAYHIADPEPVASQVAEQSVVRRTTRVTCRRRVSGSEVDLSEAATAVSNEMEQTEGIPEPWAGDKRSLDQLRKELDRKHPVSHKRRRIQSHDVVSGKGEKAKQQNEHFLQIIRGCAPVYQSMRTDNPDKDLDNKRRLACFIALEIANSGGCFLGKDECPLTPKAAIKRCMTSLKDWRRPKGMPFSQTRTHQEQDVPSEHVEAFAVDEATAIDLAASGGPLDTALSHTTQPPSVSPASSLDAEIEALINEQEPMFDLDPSDPILKTAV